MGKDDELRRTGRIWISEFMAENIDRAVAANDKRGKTDIAEQIITQLKLENAWIKQYSLINIDFGPPDPDSTDLDKAGSELLKQVKSAILTDYGTVVLSRVRLSWKSDK